MSKKEHEWIEYFFVADHPDYQRFPDTPTLHRFKACDYGDPRPHGHRLRAQGNIAHFHTKVISRGQVSITSSHAFDRYKVHLLTQRDGLQKKLADLNKRIEALPASVAELPIVNAVRGAT